jgi:hypothetical protein
MAAACFASIAILTGGIVALYGQEISYRGEYATTKQEQQPVAEQVA